MDYKQEIIFDKILEKNNIEGNITFIQHRNLKEFRGFLIERINPNHRIILYGKLKRKKVLDGRYNKLLNVGEIIIAVGILFTPFLNFLLQFLVGIALTLYLYELILLLNKNDELTVKEVLYAYRNRRKCRYWKNSLYG